MAKHRTSKRNTKRPSKLNSILLNTSIGVLSVLLIAFIFSIAQRTTQGGIVMEPLFSENTDQTLLAVDLYEENPILDIEVEVLNGCGESGLAANISDFLRDHQIDVVRSENADHFQYARTLIIQRTEELNGLKAVSKALGFDIEDRTRVLIQPSLESDVDVTLIIGRDYKAIQPVADFLETVL
jgi:hypothetical protein